MRAAMTGSAACALAMALAMPVRGAAPAEAPAAPGATEAVATTPHAKRAKKAEAEATAPATAAAEDLRYDPTGRRDPFRPPRVNQILAAGGERTPLQRYELGQLKLVAVIYDAPQARAVVEDEGGLGYIIKVGTRIGVNDGVVRAIERGRVLVEEESVDFFGERRSSEVVLEMASGERGNR